MCSLLLKNRTILHGDVIEQLRNLPDECVDCIISSPPYWGLRDYGEEGQWGLEKDFHEYLDKLRKLMFELKRVLKKTGTCWINLGDSYNSSPSNHENVEGGIHNSVIRYKKFSINARGKTQTLSIKSRMGIPERFYIQCIDDGWIARNHIPWIKENSMPSSVKDRFTNKWESIFFFAKQQRYYFNLDAVRVKPKGETKPFNIRVRENITGHAQAKLGDLSWKASDKELEEYNEKGERKQDNTLGKDGKPKANYKGFNERWSKRKYATSDETIRTKHFGHYDKDGNDLNHPSGKNPGDIFRINPRPFPKAHFATFPVDLPLKILKCSCPKNGIVLDPFFGAGTVGLAAEQLALNWIGIELKQQYIDIARKRLDPYKMERLN